VADRHETPRLLKLGARYAQVVAGVNLHAGVRAILDDTPEAQKETKRAEHRTMQLPSEGQVTLAAC
jgi:hypothetical protein